MESEKETEAAEYLISALNADAKWLAMVKKTYDTKAKASPGRVPSFAEWVRWVWARQNAHEASYLPNGITCENTVKIAKIEYFGDETVQKVLALDKSIPWMSYLCEGEVNYRFDTPGRETAGKILGILRDAKCSAVEIVDDFDPDFLSIVGERPYAG